MSENRCVCCGAVIPEGRQCCPDCVNKTMDAQRKARFDGVATRRDGTTIEKHGTLEEMTKWADWVMASDQITEISIREVRRKKHG